MADEYIGVVSIVGEEGSCKSSMGLTFPKGLFHFDLDVGGFERAAWRLPKETRIKRFDNNEDVQKTNFTEFDVLTKSYPKALDVSKLMGILTEGKKTEPSFRIKFPKQLTGEKERWQEIVTDFVVCCQTPSIQSIMLDTGTAMYKYGQDELLQELQERQLFNWRQDSKTKNAPFDENSFREKLQPLEYGEVYKKLRLIVQTARSFKKNLIWVHYPTDEYITQTDERGRKTDVKSGMKIPDGWNEFPKLADLIVWTYIKDVTDPFTSERKKVPYAKITKVGVAGMDLSAVGREFPATYEDFINARNAMRGG